MSGVQILNGWKASLLLLLFMIASFGEVAFTGSATPPEDKLSLWYDEPTPDTYYDWESKSLPIGNGMFGGSVFGGIERGHIALNEKSVWDGSSAVDNRGRYKSFGNVYFDFTAQNLTSVSEYRRDLSIERALATVSFNAGGTEYLQEYFSSFPDRVMVARFTTSDTTALNFTISVDDLDGNGAHLSGNTTYATSGELIRMYGSLESVEYEFQLKVIATGGTVAASGNNLVVRNAGEVTVLMAGHTNFNGSAPNHNSGNARERCDGYIADASGKSIDVLRANHVEDYTALFGRLTLDLDDTRCTEPTDVVKNRYPGTIDRAMENLAIQYGRYLLIASSRGYDLPNNLQGIWNWHQDPPWGCDIHTNINIQMNYWPALVGNLVETQVPFNNFIFNEVMVHGQYAANAASVGEAGWTIQTETNPFGGSSTWKWNHEGNAWYCMHLWDYFMFTMDTTFLSEVAYPVMKGACDFWIGRLIDVDGELLAPDSWSPEHGPEEDGVPFAQQLVWDLFTHSLKAAETLGIDGAFQTTLRDKIARLDPGLAVSEVAGQLREWKYTENEPGDTHRHISHLIGLYPGTQISPLIDTTFSNAAKQSLIGRGNNTTGWALAHRMNCWARVFDGNTALSILRNNFLGGGKLLDNLWDTHSPFQIDGNFGLTSGMLECLMQSVGGKVSLLSALPDGWPDGNVQGMRARGGFEVGIWWSGGALDSAHVTSLNGAVCTVVYKDKGNSFATTAGTTYRLNGELDLMDTTSSRTGQRSGTLAGKPPARVRTTGTTIHFISAGEPSQRVNIRVYRINGAVQANLFSGELQQDRTVSWQTSDVPKGVYLARCRCGGGSWTVRLTVR